MINFHDHRPDNLGAIDFVSSLSDLHALYTDLNDCIVDLAKL